MSKRNHCLQQHEALYIIYMYMSTYIQQSTQFGGWSKEKTNLQIPLTEKSDRIGFCQTEEVHLF